MTRLLVIGAALLTLAGMRVAPLEAAADNWFEIRSPNFIVWANANDGATRTLVWQLEQIRNVTKTLWPWMKVDLPKPLTIVAVKDEESMKALAPRYWEIKDGMRPASVWVSGPDQHYIAIRSDVRSPDTVTVNPHTSAYFSFANLILGSSFEGELPMWLSRGLAGVISNTLVRQSDVVIGAVIPWHLDRLRERRLPLRQMLTVSRRSADIMRDENIRYFDAQCWAFVHYLMFGEQGRNAIRLNTFVGLLARGRAADAAFAEAVGSIDDYDRAFSNYVNRSIYTGVRVKVDLGVDRERFPARPMSPVESALARASFHASMGRSAEARRLVAEATNLDPQAAGASVVQGLLAEREGRVEEAKVAYDKAVSLGTTNAYALYRSAMLAWNGADAATLQQVEKNLSKAVEVSPLFASAHASLAQVRAELKRPQSAIVPHMHKAVSLEPENPWHRIAAARVLARLNAFEEARQAAESAIKLAEDDPRATAEANRILAMLKSK